MNTKRPRLWLARAAIGVVLVWNLQCAHAFITQPQRYAPGFEVAGVAGAALVRGMGVLFVMWNVPYAVALGHPFRRRVSLIEALVMQVIGLLGETALLWALPPGHAQLRASTGRFILFDALGLALLGLAVAWTHPPRAADHAAQSE